jgi:hypothetical protein
VGFLSLLNPIKAIGGVVNGIIKTVSGSKQERDQQNHEQNNAILGQFASEFRKIQNRTWWDSLWDGLNRMPRPVIVTSVIGYFYLAYLNPVEFQVLNLALEGVPEHMWILMGTIAVFYFGSRHIESKNKHKMALSKKDFDEMQRRMAEVRATKPIEPKDFKAEMKDEDKPLSNKAIEEWNRRRKKS